MVKATGAIDTRVCQTRIRNGSCRCLPKCRHCGYGPHMGIHGPCYGQPPGSKPWGHEYEAKEVAPARVTI